MTVKDTNPLDGPVDVNIPELHLSAKYRGENGIREIEIHNCPEMEEQFKILKSGEHLEVGISDEKRLSKMAELWNIQLFLRKEDWRVKSLPKEMALCRVE